jgi:hypothetical protein
LIWKEREGKKKKENLRAKMYKIKEHEKIKLKESTLIFLKSLKILF